MLEFEALLSSVALQVSNYQKTTRNKHVLFTACLGGHDNIMPIKFINNNLDCICFTDEERIDSNGWHYICVYFKYRDPRRLAKIFKILPHKFIFKYDCSLWIDANVMLKKDVLDLIDTHLPPEGVGLSFFQHPKRNCIYSEAVECKKWGKDRDEVIDLQVSKYINDGYPPENGLIRGGFIFRRHNNANVIKIMEHWWDEIDKNSVRDQLSFNFCAWKFNFDFNYISKYIADEYFEIVFHKKYVFYGNSIGGYFKSRVGWLVINASRVRNYFLKKIGLF